jgi:hypothetical protein
VLAAVGAPPPRQASGPALEELRGGGVRVDVGTELEVRTDGVPLDRRGLADRVADGVLSAVSAFATQRDDVALFVLAVL